MDGSSLLCTGSVHSKEPGPSLENVRKDERHLLDTLQMIFNRFLLDSSLHWCEIQNVRVHAPLLKRGVCVHAAIIPILSNCVTCSGLTVGRTVSRLDKYLLIHSGVSLPNRVGCEMKQMAN